MPMKPTRTKKQRNYEAAKPPRKKPSPLAPKRKPVSSASVVDLLPNADLDPNLAARLMSGKVSGAEIGRAAGISTQTACKHLRAGRTALEIVMSRRGGA